MQFFKDGTVDFRNSFLKVTKERREELILKRERGRKKNVRTRGEDTMYGKDKPVVVSIEPLFQIDESFYQPPPKPLFISKQSDDITKMEEIYDKVFLSGENVFPTRSVFKILNDRNFIPSLEVCQDLQGHIKNAIKNLRAVQKRPPMDPILAQKINNDLESQRKENEFLKSIQRLCSNSEQYYVWSPVKTYRVISKMQ